MASKTIIVGFSHGKTIFSKLISFLTRQEISHCYTRIPFEGDEKLSTVFHAAGFNVHYMNYNYFKTFQKKIISEYKIELTDEQWLEAQKFRFENAGKPYGWKQILGYLWILINKKLNNPWADGDKSHVCVEVVAKSLGLPDAEKLLPHELEVIMKSMPSSTLLI
jgi:hypothetical protein